MVNRLEFWTELDKVPDDITHLEKIKTNFDGNNVYYHVFNYMTNKATLASKNGWMLCVVGPCFDNRKFMIFRQRHISAVLVKLEKLSRKMK